MLSGLESGTKSVNLARAFRISGDGGQERRHLANRTGAWARYDERSRLQEIRVWGASCTPVDHLTAWIGESKLDLGEVSKLDDRMDWSEPTALDVWSTAEDVRGVESARADSHEAGQG